MSVKAVEDALVQRLRDRVEAAGLVQMVYSHDDYATVAEVNMVCPSLAVVYQGYGVGGQIKPGHIQTIEFNWILVINVASAFRTDTGEGKRDAVSPIFDATLEAVLGFRPIPKFQPVELQPAPGAALSDAGFGYYPIAISTAATYRGKP